MDTTTITDEQREASARERRAIDASCRVPVLYFTTSAVFWLLVGSVLALIASFKLHSPYFLTNTPEFTFGRVRMAHLQAVGIGWSALVGMAACTWLMCRLSRAELIYPKLLIVAGTIWNIGMVADVFGILSEMVCQLSGSMPRDTLRLFLLRVSELSLPGPWPLSAADARNTST